MKKDVLKERIQQLANDNGFLAKVELSEINKNIKKWDISKSIHLNNEGDILFNNDKQVLCIDDGLYSVSALDWSNVSNRFKLVRVKFEDIKSEDTITDLNNNKVRTELSDWFKIGKDKKAFYVDGDNLI